LLFITPYVIPPIKGPIKYPKYHTAPVKALTTGVFSLGKISIKIVVEIGTTP